MITSAEQSTFRPSVGTLQISSSGKNIDYGSLVKDSTYPTTTILINGMSKNIISLPKDAILVKLPDDRLAIKSTDETSILPEGSTLSYYDEQPVLSIPDQTDVFSVSNIVDSPLQNFISKTNIIQSIQEYGQYQVQVVFFELARERTDVSLENYRIYWGDGTDEVYAADTIAASHVYSQSGPYFLTVIVTDDLGFSYVTTQQITVKYEGHMAHSYLWAQSNKTPLAAFSLSFGFLAIGLVALTENGRYRLLVLLALLLPFYSRLQKEDVLDQFVRGQIYGFIKTNPGVYYHQIRRKVGVKNGTLSYHLGVLEKTELIQSRREGLKYRAFYPTDMSFPKSERFRLTDLQIQIIRSIKSQPGLTQKEIARLLAKKPQTINYNVKVLDQAGLVRVMRRGRQTKCYPASDPQIVS